MESAKVRARAMVKAYEESGALPEQHAVLSDKEKRQQYDTFDAEGFHQRFTQEDIFRGFNFGDIFRDMGFSDDVFSTLFGVFSRCVVFETLEFE